MNDNLNADETSKISFAGSVGSNSYNGVSVFDKNAFAMLGAAELSGDAYKASCSFFFTLASNLSKNQCNILLHIIKRNRDFITEYTRKFQLIYAILERTTKMASKLFARCWTCKSASVFRERIGL